MCGKHHTNLHCVTEQSINICSQMKYLFSTLEELYCLFSSGHKRYNVLVNNKMSGKEKSGEKRRRLKGYRPLDGKIKLKP